MLDHKCDYLSVSIDLGIFLNHLLLNEHNFLTPKLPPNVNPRTSRD